MSRDWKKGDEAWIASFLREEVRRDCPICFGQRAVRVILGDESVVATPCDYCGKGYEGPRGYVMEYERKPRAERITVESVTSVDGEVQDIRHSGSYCSRPTEVFQTEAEALAHAQTVERDTLAEEARRSDWGRRNTVQTLTWSIGYHLREAKEHRRQLAYHEERAVVLKEKRRPSPAPNGGNDGK